MALRDQPYFPFYVQDFLTDEKLMECSAASVGVYIKVMCIMHKSEPYGTILLKQKDKQTGKQIQDFALKIARSLPFSLQIIETALTELLEENVLFLEGDFLVQKRMVKDNDLSIKRSIAGSKGGNKNKFAQAKTKAKPQANSEYENEIENVNETGIVIRDRGAGERAKIKTDSYGLFETLVKKWIEYKKAEHRETYKTQATLDEFVKKLIDYSGGDFHRAEKIIDNSIANRWKGIFPEKPGSNGRFEAPKKPTAQEAGMEAIQMYLQEQELERQKTNGTTV